MGHADGVIKKETLVNLSKKTDPNIRICVNGSLDPVTGL